ncbi:MAG: hypothetical protein AAF919_13505 [Pseudomonadota bacterium]
MTSTEREDWLLRLGRILLTVFLLGLVASAVAVLLNPRLEDAHYLHRLGGLAFILSFGFPVWAPAILVLSVALLWFDRRGISNPLLLTSVWLVSLGIWAIWRSSEDFALDTAAITATAITICGLAYWLLVGRLGGRPGFAFPREPTDQWGKRLIYSSVAVGVPLASVLAPLAVRWALEERPDRSEAQIYTTRYERELTTRVQKIAARLPDAEACMVEGADPSVKTDLLKMDWDRIDNATEAEVCIFRILSELGGIHEFRSFFEAQGLQVSSGSDSPERPYLERDGRQRASAYWNARHKGPLFPTTGPIRRWLRAAAHTSNFHVWYDEKGEYVIAVRYGASIL